MGALKAFGPINQVPVEHHVLGMIVEGVNRDCELGTFGWCIKTPCNRALFRLRFSNPGVQRLNENVQLLRILRYLRERRSNGDCPITYHYYILAQLAVSIHRSILYTSPLFIWFVFRTLMSMNPLFYVLGTIQKLVWCRANYHLEWGQPQAIYIRGRWGTS